MPPLEPLRNDSPSVVPRHAHVSVCTGLFAWALRQNRFGKRADRKVKLQNRSFGPDGLKAPTRRDVTRASFSNYFSFGTQRDLKPLEDTPIRHVVRNRVLFLCGILGVVIYTLVWIAR